MRGLLMTNDDLKVILDTIKESFNFDSITQEGHDTVYIYVNENGDKYYINYNQRTYKWEEGK